MAEIGFQIQDILKNTNAVLLGVTGGIASGKTTVSRMLEALGAPAIDFDILARQVVGPGKPAYAKIVDYFGKQVVKPDGTLNRERISEIVFSDAEKRKALERFIHPAVFDTFAEQVRDIAGNRPDAVIQGVVPLLYEVNMQSVFHKIVVVHVSPETQLKRLLRREGITVEAAAARIASQMSIDEKRRQADYVIDNTGNVEETEKRVAEVWQLVLTGSKSARHHYSPYHKS